jgi:hypothetical protein
VLVAVDIEVVRVRKFRPRAEVEVRAIHLRVHPRLGNTALGRLISFSGRLHLATDHSSKQQQFQFFDLRCPIYEFIPDALHPNGGHSRWQVNAKQFRKYFSGNPHRW